MLAALAILSAYLLPVSALAQTPSATEPLPSWNDGPAKQAIVDFVKATTDQSSPNFVPPEDRVATFVEDAPVVHAGNAACLVWEHRLDNAPFVVAEFIVHDSKLLFGELDPRLCRRDQHAMSAAGRNAD
jgi:hypothetical protein